MWELHESSSMMDGHLWKYQLFHQQVVQQQTDYCSQLHMNLDPVGCSHLLVALSCTTSKSEHQ